MFRLAAVSKSYASRPALGPLSLDMIPGQTTVLIGPSGCGKSTLLRLLIGLVTPEAGTVHFNDTRVHPATFRQVRQSVGYMIQDGGLFPHLSARGNVTLMARHLDWDRERIASRVQTLAGLTRFPLELLDNLPHQLSGGQRQRVSLMRALMLDPAALLLDEPLGALDPLVRSELQDDLREIFQSLRKTVVLVTHDLGEASFFADRIVLMQDGRIVQDGTPADLWQRPADPFVTRFIRAQRGPQIPGTVP